MLGVWFVNLNGQPDGVRHWLNPAARNLFFFTEQTGTGMAEASPEPRRGQVGEQVRLRLRNRAEERETRGSTVTSHLVTH